VNVALSSALSGIRANLTRMNESAARVAGQKADPVDGAVEQLRIKASFEANVFALKTAHDMERSTFRLWA
jgi:uncharacterized protein YkuJ